MPTHQIALLLFSRTPHQEARAKRWLRGKGARHNTSIAKWLDAESRRRAEEAPYPVFHVTEREQRGRTFGERFAYAFQQLFDQGFEAVVAVGNDAPQASLPWDLLSSELGAGNPVLGPDFRGGCYLTAIPKKGFDAGAFAALPWQSTRLMPALTAFLQERGSGEPCLLPRHGDLNTEEDLRWLALRGDKASQLLQWLRGLLFGCAAKSETPLAFPKIYSPSTALTRRGPPRFCSSFDLQ